jgi:glycosyltransferase involved in cell wall biosynthesis
LKVLHLIPTLDGGGAERQLSYLAVAQQQLGLEVHVGCVRSGPNFNRLEAAGVPVTRLGPSGNYSPRLPFKIANLSRMIKPNVIQTWLTQMDILGGAVALSYRIPFVLSERTAAQFYTGSLKNRIRNLVASRADAIVANSSGGLEYWRARLDPMRCSAYIIRNAIPFDEIENAVPIKTQDIPDVSFDDLMLFVGRMVEVKNLDSLTPALIYVLKNRPRTIAVLLGDGPLAPHVAKAAMRAGLEKRLRVLPFSLRIFGWMKRASVFVSVSRFEGSPNAVLEAAACGCPLVVSDISAHREFLDENSAVFVDGRSSESIARGIIGVLESPSSAYQRASSARLRVAKQTEQSMANEYLNVYRRIQRRERRA